MPVEYYSHSHHCYYCYFESYTVSSMPLRNNPNYKMSPYTMNFDLRHTGGNIHSPPGRVYSNHGGRRMYDGDIPRTRMIRWLDRGTNGRRIHGWVGVRDRLWCDCGNWWIHDRLVFCRTCRRGGGCCIPEIMMNL